MTLVFVLFIGIAIGLAIPKVWPFALRFYEKVTSK